MNLTEVSIRKPVLAWMIMLAAIVFGLVAGRRIGISQFPDVDFPTVNVRVSWEGAAPEVMEADVVEIIEESLVQVEGIRSITSNVRQGQANITLELELSRDVDLAVQEVQSFIAQANRLLPSDLDPPVVSKTNPEDQPIMWIGVSGPYSRQFLSEFARYRLKERLQTVPGVGEIFLGGYLERNVRIWVDADRLEARKLTVTDIASALRREHVELPAGRIETAGRELTVRVLGEAIDLESLRKLVIREVDGAPTYLSDVALVEDGFEDVRRLGRINGEPAQGLGVRKQRGANAVAVARGVRQVIQDLESTGPEGLRVGVNFDGTQFIEESVHEIQFELVLSVLLTALVCWVFLGSLSSTLNVVLAIPMSLLGTVAIIYFLGYTLNTFTLLALGLAVGIVVDDAIMVLENIYRHSEMGKERRLAAWEGTKEITFAALASTVAIVAIFIPVIFMDGVVGRYFLQFGVALSLAVILSYLEAITLAPSRCAQLLDTSHQRTTAVGRIVDRGLGWLSDLYARWLAIALRAPGAVTFLALILFIGSVFVLRALPMEFTPSQDQSRLMIRTQTAVGSNLEETDRIFREAEAFINQRPEVDRTMAIVGGFGGGDVNSGTIFLTMVPPEQRMSQAEFAAMARKALNQIPGLRAVVIDLSQQGFTARRGFPVEFSVRGSNWNELIAASDIMRQQLAASGVVVDVDTDYELGLPELRIEPDRARAANMGISIEDVATTINALIGGVRVGKYNTGGRRIDVRLRLLASQRARPSDIGRLKVRARDNLLVPLSILTTFSERPALQSITRQDRERAISIFANVAPGHAQDEALRKVEELAAGLPAGVHVVLGGASVAFRESMLSLAFAFAMGILVAYMVLAAQFNSFLHPVTVLTILPLSVAGAAGALLLTGESLNMFSMIGLLLLMGLVKKNSIILVDYANQLRETGLSPHDAVLRAGPLRLRPILMTTTATMCAALPIALGLGPGSEIRTPMAYAILGGMLVSTPLSLFVVPCFYLLASRLKASRGRARVMGSLNSVD
ncbi:MAG: efflux RND transporter permease subunit [Deltaproteobacteria bacterium]|nr:efflux RND transporter permease subunit [Deltaproteobacteria bacterium]